MPPFPKHHYYLMADMAMSGIDGLLRAMTQLNSDGFKEQAEQLIAVIERLGQRKDHFSMGGGDHPIVKVVGVTSFKGLVEQFGEEAILKNIDNGEKESHERKEWNTQKAKELLGEYAWSRLNDTEKQIARVALYGLYNMFREPASCIVCYYDEATTEDDTPNTKMVKRLAREMGLPIFTLTAPLTPEDLESFEKEMNTVMDRVIAADQAKTTTENWVES